MKIVCVSEYDVISEGPKPNSKWLTHGFNIINDNGIEKWHGVSPMGIIQVLPLKGIWLEYLNDDSYGLTKGKIYSILDKYSAEYVYFMNDNNKFVGISKRNYFGGNPNFRNPQKERDIKIEHILKTK